MIDHVIVLPRADEQIIKSAQWWATHHSTEQAARWLNGIETAIANLKNDPQRYAVAPENDLYDFPITLRQLPFGVGARPTHRVVFEIRHDTVFVHAVRHLSQQYLTPDDL